MADSADTENARQSQVAASQLWFDIPPGKVPIIYTSAYNIGFLGLEKLHPFDSTKWGRCVQLLLEKKPELNKKQIVEPRQATKEDLLVVHTEKYLESLKSSWNVAAITEVPPVALLPNFLVQLKLLRPLRFQVGGTVLASKVAHERGWAINVGGGFHHCCGYQGGGFCAYADVTLTIRFARQRLGVRRVMIVDLDAHQGNGHERDFPSDKDVYIMDVYNKDIYPMDEEAKQSIRRRVELRSGTGTKEYLAAVRENLQAAEAEFSPELLVYIAGTDVLEGDPLGRLKVSPQGVVERDEMVFAYARRRGVPIVMVTAGGYQRTNAAVISDSICNLAAKGLAKLELNDG